MKTLFKHMLVAALLMAPVVQAAAVAEKPKAPGLAGFEDWHPEVYRAESAVNAEQKGTASPWWLTLLLLGPCLGVVMSRQIEALPNNSRVQGFTHCFSFGEGDLTETTANTAQAFTVAIPVNTIIKDCLVLLDVPFEDTADAAFNSTAVTVGDSGSATRFMSATELNVNGTEITIKKMSGSATAYPAADTLSISFASMAAKSLSSLNKGKVRIYVNMVKQNQIG